MATKAIQRYQDARDNQFKQLLFNTASLAELDRAGVDGKDISIGIHPEAVRKFYVQSGKFYARTVRIDEWKGAVFILLSPRHLEHELADDVCRGSCTWQVTPLRESRGEGGGEGYWEAEPAPDMSMVQEAL